MKKKYYQSRIYFAGLLVILFTWAFLSGTSAWAQGLNQWSPQQQIPGYKPVTLPPYLIADQNHTIHAFAAQQVGDEGNQIGIIYSQWTLEQGWTFPVDILLSPFKNRALMLAGFLDQRDIMHVIFFGGDNTGANIYYSRAPAVYAGRASAWSAPSIIGEGALTPENGALAGDDEGNLVILFSGNQHGNGLYAVYSGDGGDTWSDPTPIFLTGNDQLWPADSKIYLSQSGQLYTVWSTYNIAGQGVAVYFARLDLGQRHWSDPLQLATGTGLGVSLPNVIEYESEVLVVYYNSRGNGLWLIRSGDNGQTWTQPVRIAPTHIGRNGAASFAVDSNDILHMFFGGRIPGRGGPDIHGMWHTAYQDGPIRGLEPVVAGPLIHDLVGDKGFDPFDAHAVISQGNVLVVTWRTDPGQGTNGVWYSSEILNSPEIPLETLSPSPSSDTSTTSLSESRVASEPTQSVTPRLEVGRDRLLTRQPENGADSIASSTLLLPGFISAALFLSVVIAVHSLRSSNRH
jgi:hypothetical protein